ncbi:hypothetical protein [Micromonospora tarensis]|nr:hypothetical protein [Micromonospora tarensis]
MLIDGIRCRIRTGFRHVTNLVDAVRRVAADAGSSRCLPALR